MLKSILTWIVAGFVVSLGILLVVSLISLGSIDALRAAGKDQLEWSTLTKELGDITPAVLLAENGRRGYILTRNPSAMKIYKDGVELTKKEIAEVLNFSQDHPEFLKRVVEIKQIVDEKLLNLYDSMTLFQENGDWELQRFATSKGTDLTNQILSSIEALTNEILKESEQREAIVNQRTYAAKQLIYLIGFLALGGGCAALFVIARDISLKASLQKKQEELIEQLSHALKEVKALSGLLPICASCKKIRSDSGYWTQIEVYLTEHSEAHFSHGLCEECAAKLFPDLYVPKEIRDQTRKADGKDGDHQTAMHGHGGISG